MRWYNLEGEEIARFKRVILKRSRRFAAETSGPLLNVLTRYTSIAASTRQLKVVVILRINFPFCLYLSLSLSLSLFLFLSLSRAIYTSSIFCDQKIRSISMRHLGRRHDTFDRRTVKKRHEKLLSVLSRRLFQKGRV